MMKRIASFLIFLFVIGGYYPQDFPERAEGSSIVLAHKDKGDLFVQINGSLNWTGEDKNTKGTITSNFTISGTMTLHKQKHDGDYEYYKIENLQTTYSHHAQFHRKKPAGNVRKRFYWRSGEKVLHLFKKGES